MKKLLKSEICGSVNTGSLFTLKSQQNRLLKKKKKSENAKHNAGNADSNRTRRG